jgi:hypothetical protein
MSIHVEMGFFNSLSGFKILICQHISLIHLPHCVWQWLIISHSQYLDCWAFPPLIFHFLNLANCVYAHVFVVVNGVIWNKVHIAL